jgi:hypothetical protein
LAVVERVYTIDRFLRRILPAGAGRPALGRTARLGDTAGMETTTGTDPGGGGRFGWHRFGGEVTGYASFGGLTVPAAGRLGWHWGGDGWERGEFFRYRITALEPSGEPPARSR